MAPLRWGIAGAGTISHDFACAVSTLPKADHHVVAVAARGLENAQKFAELHGIRNFHVGFEALARDPNVDIVYVGTMNSLRYEIALQMLDGGKHVLCERPLCVNEGQSKALLEYARERKLFCMEGISSRFFPAYGYIRNRIRNGDLGDIREVKVELGFPISKVQRIRMQHLGGGSVLDLGLYSSQLALWILEQSPAEIKTEGEMNEENVDVHTNVELKFPSGATVKIRTSGVETLSNTATISGSEGTIKLPDFWCPTELTDLDGTIKFYTLPMSKVECIQKNSVGLRYEAEECRLRIEAGDLESSIVSHSDSLAVARVQDTIRKQMGVEMAEDYIFKP
ncbi:trans-1,2-dihydrobenzene-1,2-diol dehydrogenase-like [Uranotaenia lowii]|uniref:trans-1,2-dihydrobenzene-1,2-diol dehydrogenase-like n=1 Tax=Uranotaenia lowii TaxID=190385 RepID=UPI002479C5AE|nr:trans-1,2-dihydrobenzene-1,2-diol dehydrogenase-like [Uranotaenia lowii]